MREIVLDTETTGLAPEQGHRLIEIACVELVNKFPTGAAFHHLVDPERDIDEGARNVHGISRQMLIGKPRFAEVADGFLAFIGNAALVIHNARFDMAFINAELERIGRPAISITRAVDTLEIAKRKHPGSPNSLDALCKRYGIDTSRREKHSALVDSELLALVYVELVGGSQAKLELLSRPAPERSPGAGAQERTLARAAPLPPRVTSEQRAAHRAFLAVALKDALWLKAEG